MKEQWDMGLIHLTLALQHAEAWTSLEFRACKSQLRGKQELDYGGGGFQPQTKTW
jgi:hypothetical protein